MLDHLTPEQRQRRAAFEAFAAEHVVPHAAAWDAAQEIPRDALAALGRAGYLGATVPTTYGGLGWDAVTFGLLNDVLGRHDSAYTGYVTVQSMIGMALAKWGTPAQRREWLEPIARGEKIGSFVLTEPAGGSDLQAMTTQYAWSADGKDLVLNGEKKWISCAQVSDVFLVFGKLESQSLACLVPRDSAGFEIEPIKDMLGFRAAGLGRLRFRDVRVPAANIVGKPGFALSHVAPIGLHYGRISTACSALGLLRGCCEESVTFAAGRMAGNRPIGDMGMVQSMLARMGADLSAAELLCWSACRAEDERRPDSFTAAMTAKYFASRAAVQAAVDAIQIHGAHGCHESAPIARYFRASKIMELIEGTTQVHERLLAQEMLRTAKVSPAARRSA